MIYSCPLVERKLVARETLSISVHRPAEFSFRAGQYVDLTLTGAPHRDRSGPTRSMSIASAPGADRLEFVMRLRGSAFKRNLAEVPLGTELMVEGPMDDLRFRAEPGREKVFVAGGVGVAPFLGILREAAATEDPLSATLIYANRRPDDALYLRELQQLERELPGFRLIPTMTAVEPDTHRWAGERLRPGSILLQKYLPEIVGPAYYVAGSSSLVSGVRSMLLAAGVSDLDIGLEMYAGY